MSTASRSARLGLLFTLGWAAMASSAAAQQLITCSSSDGRYQRCDVDTRGGVRLERQQSHAVCRYNDTWGYDRRGIWVDDGCRATFRVGSPGWSDHSGGSWGGSGASTLRCESRDDRRHHCDANTRGGVTLDNQLSRSDCTFGRTWGYDRSGIWVDRGCRADFRLGRGGYGGGGNWGGGPPARGTVRCESESNRRNYCYAETRGGVQLQRQLSRSDCTFGRTWGYDSGGVWVRDGCRAEFSLARGYNSRYDDRDDHDDAKVAAGALLVGALAAAVASGVAEGNDREAVETCQEEIEQRIRDSRRGAAVVFSSGASRKLGDRERDVQGEGRVVFGRDSDEFTYECRIDMRQTSVLDADWGYTN